MKIVAVRGSFEACTCGWKPASKLAVVPKGILATLLKTATPTIMSMYLDTLEVECPQCRLTHKYPRLDIQG